MTTPEALSLTGKAWKLRELSELELRTLVQKHELPEALARVLLGRGITAPNAEEYLNPTLKQLMPDPSHLKDMDKAVERVCTALEKGEKIALFGDYDVDGATSTALLKQFLETLGHHPLIHIPDRVNEGYGPNIQAFEKLHSQGAKVVITMDCGTAAHEVIQQGNQLGLETIVLDHHAGEPELPRACAVVNPNRVDEDSKYTYLAAVGMTFLFVVALNRKLRENGYYTAQNLKEPSLLSYLDLVALGTVCDVVPLIDLNRAFVSQGLKILAQRQNVGLKALCDVGGVNERPEAYHLGFILGPRINAGGRVGTSSMGAQLLSTSSESEANSIAEKLNQFNEERKAIESLVQEQAFHQAEQLLAKNPDLPLVMVSGQGWHEGVIGIVAGRLKERYHKPTAVITFNEEGIGKASCRSVEGVDIGALVIAATQAELLLKGGGHKMAAGFSVQRDRLEDLQKFFLSRMPEKLPPAVLHLDGILSPASVTEELIETLAQAAPYGQSNTTPKFMFENLKLQSVRPIGKGGLKAYFSDSFGKGRLDSVMFKAEDSPIGEQLMTGRGKSFHVAGNIKMNSYTGSPQLYIEDVKVV